MAQSHMVTTGTVNAYPNTTHSQYVPQGGTRNVGNPHTTASTHYNKPNTYSSQYVGTPQVKVTENRGEPRLVSSNQHSHTLGRQTGPTYVNSNVPHGVTSQPINRTVVPNTYSSQIQPTNVVYNNRAPTTQSQFIPQNINGLDMKNLDTILDNLKHNEEKGHLQCQ